MARTNRGIHCPNLVRVSYRPRVAGASWSSVSLDPAMARLAEALWGSRWSDEVRELAVRLADADPPRSSVSRAVQAFIATAAAAERLRT